MVDHQGGVLAVSGVRYASDPSGRTGGRWDIEDLLPPHRSEVGAATVAVRQLSSKRPFKSHIGLDASQEANTFTIASRTSLIRSSGCGDLLFARTVARHCALPSSSWRGSRLCISDIVRESKI